jgi:hypothetical protein
LHESSSLHGSRVQQILYRGTGRVDAGHRRHREQRRGSEPTQSLGWRPSPAFPPPRQRPPPSSPPRHQCRPTTAWTSSAPATLRRRVSPRHPAWPARNFVDAPPMPVRTRAPSMIAAKPARLRSGVQPP